MVNPPPTQSVAKPYVGPYPIEFGQPFYGRDTETEDLASRLIARRIVLLHAPSGAGKTSLIQAGLIPALEPQSFLALRTIRVNRVAPPSELPDNRCNRFVLSTLISLEEGLPTDHQTPLAEFANVHLGDYLETHRDLYAEHSSNPSARRTLLVFDQFEEILNIDPADRKSKEEFFGELMELLHDNRYWFLFAMREEYLARLEPYLSYFPDRLSAHYGLEFLGPQAALQAIQKPAQEFGVTFQDDAARKLVDDLRQVRQQAENGTVSLVAGMTIEPVQLQVVCSYLWDQPRIDLSQITLQDVIQWADVDNALKLYYANRIGEISKQTAVSERMLRKWFEERLVTAGGLRIQVLAGQEQEYGITPECMRLLIDAFLVRAETRRGATWYELAHDRLVQPVYDSNKEWFKANLSLLQLRAEQWDKAGRPPALLLTNNELPQAAEWEKNHAAEMTTDESEFFAESHSAFELRGRATRIWRLAIILGAVVVVVSILTILVFLSSRRNQIQAIQTNRSLATLYGQVSQEQPAQENGRKLVTAIRAMEITSGINQTDTNAARQAIYDVLRITGGRRFEAAKSTDSAEPNALSVVGLSRDGRWLAAGGIDPMISIWDLQDQGNEGTPVANPILLYGHTSPITALAFDPQARYLASASQDGVINMWDLGNPNTPPKTLHDTGGRVNSLSFSPDGRWLASGSAVSPDQIGDKNHLLLLWDLDCPELSEPIQFNFGSFYPTPTQVDQTDDIEDAVIALAFSADSRWLVAAGTHDSNQDDPTTALLAAWRVDDLPTCGSVLPPVNLANLPIPDIDPATGETIDQATAIANLEGSFLTLVISPGLNGEDPYLVTGGNNGNVRTWQLTRDGQIQGGVIIGQHGDVVNDLAFAPDNQWLTSASSDDKIFFWNRDDLQFALEEGVNYVPDPGYIQEHTDDVKSLAFSPDSQWLFSASSDRTIRAWDFRDQEPEIHTPVLSIHQGSVNALETSSYPPRLASASEDGTVRLLNLVDANPAAQPRTASMPLSAGPITDVNRQWAMIYSGLDDQAKIIKLDNVAIDDIASSDLMFEHPSDFQIDRVKSSPGGEWLAATGASPSDSGEQSGLLVWRIDTNALTSKAYPVFPISKPIAALDFDPSESWLVTRDVDGQATLWQLDNDPPSATQLDTAGLPVLSLAYSPDGHWLAAGSTQGRFFGWNLNRLQNRGGITAEFALQPDYAQQTEEQEPVCALAFRPKHDLLAIGGSQQLVQTWRSAKPGGGLGEIEAFEPAFIEWRENTKQPEESTPTEDSTDLCLDRPDRMTFSQDGRWLAVAVNTPDPNAVGGAGMNGRIFLADLALLNNPITNKVKIYIDDAWADLHLGDIPDQAWQLTDNLGEITDLAFSQDGHWLAASDDHGSDSAIHLWSTLAPDKEPVHLPTTLGPVQSLVFSDDEEWLVTGDQAGAIRIWAIDPGELLHLACRVLGRQPAPAELRELLPAENWQNNSSDFCQD